MRTNRLTWLLLITCAALAAGPAGAATLDEYLAEAEQNNPAVASASKRWEAARQKVSQAEALPNPKLSYTYYIEEVETRVGPQEQKFGVSQTLPWFGKRGLRGSVAAEAAAAAHEQYQAERLKLAFEIKDAFYEYYYVSRALAIAGDHVELLKHLESVAQAKYKAGGPVSGVIKTQVELGKLDDRLRSLRDQLRPAAARFNAALDRPLETPVDMPDPVPFSDVRLSDEAVLRAFPTNNPDLKQLEHAAAREEARRRLARKDYFPDVMLGIEYVDTGEARMSGVEDSGKDPVMAMVTLDLPVWRRSYRAGVREAALSAGAARDARAGLENQLGARLEMTLYRYRDTERKISLYRDTLLPQAEQSLNVAEEAYRSGQADFLSVIDAQRLLLEMQLSLEREKASREQRLAEIEMLTGRPADELSQHTNGDGEP